MACFFNTLLSGWISPEDFDNHVKSTYGNNFNIVYVEKTAVNLNLAPPAEFENSSDSKKTKTYKFLHNVKSGEFYSPDSPQVVAFKCFAIAIAAPVYTLARMFFQVCRIIYLIGKIFYESIKCFIESLNRDENGCKAFLDHILIDCSLRILTEVFYSKLFEFIKTPYYGLGLFIAACEGFIHDPYKAKTEIALIERQWNQGKTFHHDWRIKHRNYNSCLEGILHSDAFFLASCMQPFGSEHDNVDISNSSNRSKYSILNTELEPFKEDCTFPPCIPMGCC